jgi:alpha-beta hydrolase superfamily lysophospholipase
LFGASLGGTIALLAATHFQNLKAVALWAPVASGELWYRDFLIRHPQFQHVDPSQVLASYRGVQLSAQFRNEFRQMQAHQATLHLSKIPLLFMHAEKDETVSLAHFEAFRTACRNANVPSHFIKYADGEHSLGFSSHLTPVLQESTRWFAKYFAR